MSVKIADEIYSVDCKELYLPYKNIEHIPDSIGNLINLEILFLNNNQINILPDSFGNLINLQKINLDNNQITILPDSIGNLINLRDLYLTYNKIMILPNEILKIKKALIIDETSYEINNLNIESKILIFSNLKIKLTNLPVSLKEIWISKGLEVINIKLPFGCEIKYY